MLCSCNGSTSNCRALLVSRNSSGKVPAKLNTLLNFLEVNQLCELVGKTNTKLSCEILSINSFQRVKKRSCRMRLLYDSMAPPNSSKISIRRLCGTRSRQYSRNLRKRSWASVSWKSSQDGPDWCNCL